MFSIAYNAWFIQSNTLCHHTSLMTITFSALAANNFGSFKLAAEELESDAATAA